MNVHKFSTGFIQAVSFTNGFSLVKVPFFFEQCKQWLKIGKKYVFLVIKYNTFISFAVRISSVESLSSLYWLIGCPTLPVILLVNSIAVLLWGTTFKRYQILRAVHPTSPIFFKSFNRTYYTFKFYASFGSQCFNVSIYTLMFRFEFSIIHLFNFNISIKHHWLLLYKPIEAISVIYVCFCTNREQKVTKSNLQTLSMIFHSESGKYYVNIKWKVLTFQKRSCLHMNICAELS